MQNTLDFSGYNIPAHTQGALTRYVTQGCLPGGFLTAVLANDLIGAVSQADEQNRAALAEIVKFIYNRLPSAAQGTPDEQAEFAASVWAQL